MPVLVGGVNVIRFPKSFPVIVMPLQQTPPVTVTL